MFLSETGWCGCGLPEETYRTLLFMLEWCKDHQPLESLRERITDEGARYWLLYDLDRLGLTQHGGSVDGSWLSEKGRAVMEALRLEDLDKLGDHDWCIHGFDIMDDSHDCFAEE